MNIEQFQSFVEMLPEIEKALQAKGISIPRPKYDGAQPVVEGKQDDEDEETEDKVKATDEDEDEDAKPVRAGRLDKFKHKANHEATSDEDN